MAPAHALGQQDPADLGAGDVDAGRPRRGGQRIQGPHRRPRGIGGALEGPSSYLMKSPPVQYSDEAARNLIELTELPYKFSRPFAAPPGVPPERAKALQEAFVATHRDPLYVEEAARLNIDVSPTSANEAMAALERIEKAPPQLLDYLRKLFAESKG